MPLPSGSAQWSETSGCGGDGDSGAQTASKSGVGGGSSAGVSFIAGGAAASATEYVRHSFKASLKHRLLSLEIPATRFSCFSGSLRPKLGLCILLIFLILGLCLVLVPIMDAPTLPAADKIAHAEAVAAVAQANNVFTKNLYAELLKAQVAGNNMVFSPYSVSAVVSMALAGARGTTAEQMRAGLSLPADEHLLPGYQDALAVLKGNANYTLSTANRLFVHDGYKLLEAFLETTATHYHAKPEEVDFAESEPARNHINKWVEDQTKKRIKDLIPQGAITALTRLVLVNAIYFKGDWSQKFDVEMTEDEKFDIAPGQQVDVKMMHLQKEFLFGQVKELKALALEMPYKGDRLSMVVLLPKEKFGLAEMEKTLSKFDLHGLQLTRRQKVQLALPRFKIESSHDLVAGLQALGLKDMFLQGAADFSGMSGGRDLYVGAVMQKAFIEVNEEGSEAAAATGMVMMMRSMPMIPPFICDHPFMFYIKDKLTGMILFAGRVSNPSQ